eukprot:jgi/Chlat1/717/Chrsp104S01206
MQAVYRGAGEALRSAANEPSVGLFYVQQHVRKAVPALAEIEGQVRASGNACALERGAAEDMTAVVQSMQACGPQLVDRIRDNLQAASSSTTAIIAHRVERRRGSAQNTPMKGSPRHLSVQSSAATSPVQSAAPSASPLFVPATPPTPSSDSALRSPATVATSLLVHPIQAAGSLLGFRNSFGAAEQQQNPSGSPELRATIEANASASTVVAPAESSAQSVTAEASKNATAADEGIS